MEEFDHTAYWNTRLSGRFGLETVGYIGLGKGFNKWMYKVRESVFLWNVRKLKRNNSLAVLDVGCGTGFYTELWTRLGYSNVSGVDISFNAVDRLKDKYPHFNFFQGDISLPSTDLPRADLISCMDVLFHVVDDKGFCVAVKKLSEALNSGGVLIFSDNFLHSDERRVKHHVSRTLEQYEALLKENGLRILTRKPMFFFLNYPVDSRNLLLACLWKAFLRFIPGREWLGYSVGVALFPFEKLFVSLLKEGPSTEIMVCEKVG